MATPTRKQSELNGAVHWKQYYINIAGNWQPATAKGSYLLPPPPFFQFWQPNKTHEFMIHVHVVSCMLEILIYIFQLKLAFPSDHG